MRVGLWAALCVMSVGSVASADIELQNDSFTSGGQADFMGGFAVGEIGASRFVAPDAGRQLLKVHFLYGPDATQRTITLNVYDDTNGTSAPGTELFTMDFQVTGSSTAMQEIDLTADNVVVTQQFRVGIQFQDGGSPSIACDADQTNTTGRNFFYTIPPSAWSSTSGVVPGDWIIRAVISGVGGGGNPDAGVPMDAPATGGTCSGNTQCPTGQFCDLTNHTCTFECRTSADCGGGTCNSLGMCVNANNGGSGGGCCEADGQRGGALASLLAFGVLLRLRRRRG